MTRPPTGAHPSPHDPRDRDFSDFLRSAGAAAGVEPRTIDVSQPHTRRVQGQPSCVGYAMTTMIQDWDQKLWDLNATVRVRRPDGTIAAVPRQSFPILPLLSGQWDYTGGRLIAAKMGGASLDPAIGLPNDGSNCRLDIMWIRDVDNGGGCRAEAVWPDVPDNATRIPDADALGAEPLVTVDGYYRIFGSGDVDALRAGWIGACEAFERGASSKPSSVMPVTKTYASTPEGAVYDDQLSAERARADAGEVLGTHCQQGAGYDGAQRALVHHSTWDGADTYRVREQHMADAGVEFWVFTGIVYIEVAA